MKARKHIDSKAWVDNPEYNYVYNKLWLCKTQDIKAAPVPIVPDSYPVFYKPIVNMYSLGAHSFKAESPVDEKLHPGLFWMEYLEGIHWTTNCYFDGKEIREPNSFLAEKEEDIFVLWEPYNINLKWVNDWLCENIGGYEGPLNIEGIGKNILEVHLRHSKQVKKMVSDEGPNKFCAPIITEEPLYEINEENLELLRDQYEDSDIIITLQDGKPELGIGDNRRLGYVVAGRRDLVFDIKELLLNKVLSKCS